MNLSYYFILFILGGITETLLHVCLKRSTLEHLEARGGVTIICALLKITGFIWGCYFILRI